MKKYIKKKIDKESKKKMIFIGKITLIMINISFWMFLFIDFNVIVDNEKETLWIHAPSIVRQNDPFEVSVEAWDQYERLAGTYQDAISFEIESYSYNNLNKFNAIAYLPEDHVFSSNFMWNGLIPAYRFKDADNGKKTFEMSITSLGIHYIKVVEKKTGLRYRSNPIIVKPETEVFKSLFWGDIHGHTILSDGSGSPTETYEFARDVALLDFAALTDHAEMFPRFGDLDLFDTFQNYIDTTNEFNDDGKFATIVALEWTPWVSGPGTLCSNGHVNVYFKNDNMPFYSSLTHYNPEELYNDIKKHSKNEFISWSHHSIRKNMPTDFGFYDEDINTMTEIYSCHGSCECWGEDNLYTQGQELVGYGYSVRDALKMGRKLGIMASGDSHDGRLGHSISHTKARTLTQQPYTLAAFHYGTPYPNGLTGIYAYRLDRRSVFDALKRRSAYATTWVNRHYIDFKINGINVGVHDSTLTVPEDDSKRQIEILMCADGVSMFPNSVKKIVEIKIYKNSKLWKSYGNINEPIKQISVTDDSVITGTKYENCVLKDDGNWYVNERSIQPVDPDELNTNGADYYYVRVLDSEGGAAWNGPIWVQVL